MPCLEFRGSRRASNAYLSSLARAREFSGLPDGMTRFDLIHLVRDAGACVGMTRRQIEHLEFLITYTRDRDWTAGERPVVYLTVMSTARARQVSERQVRNLEYGLSDAGALTWNDSGNHRRTGRRDADGRIVFAYGVDLSPLVSRIAELEAWRDKSRREGEEWDRLKRSVSSLKRSIRAMLARAADEGLVDLGDDAWIDKTAILDYRVRAETPLARMREAAGRLRLLSDDLQALVGCGWRKETSPKAEVSCRHIHTTNNPPSDKSDTCTAAAAGDGEADAPGGAALDSGGSAGDAASRGAPSALNDDRGEGRGAPEPPRDPDTPPGGDGGGEHEGTETLDLFPEERPAWRADTGIRHVSLENLVAVLGERFLSVMPKSVITEGEQPAWEDVVHAARDLAPLLGIGERLLWRAAGLMGWRAVAVCIVLIDRRSRDGAADPVLNAGGYFRGCVEKARRGELRLHASVFGALGRPGAGKEQ